MFKGNHQLDASGERARKEVRRRKIIGRSALLYVDDMRTSSCPPNGSSVQNISRAAVNTTILHRLVLVGRVVLRTISAMPAYHSIFLEDQGVAVIGNFPLLPLRTRTRGPAYTLPALPPSTSDVDVDPDSESYDCVDEILSLFRANAFFRNFEIKGPADRMLIYGILFVSECLSKVKPGMTAREAEKALINAALDQFAIPGDVSFPLNQAFEPPRDRQDAETLRQYISQVRQEIAVRLHARLYPGGVGPSKWWLSFAKRKFMGKSL
ncbi:hypothetical protein DTO280E4_8680 [Paecilomyces variotii]|nr:hypothetical protein DTO166G5_6820 [Paecilomyces variotii]KAJ9248553.1 hypothetical protein DTO207G8_7332 [Paecilomyces variotii]KAJ9256264.1 hypothetical protein DTO195F2_5989 [Paecilomyces variotii]KAJ9350358.1 hypothetical protein DTO280E4_8680 [Paecilomyces variotii]KAJ9367346.1 hypothetical protein DTO282E5_7994 [Paecilomyces variotii]